MAHKHETIVKTCAYTPLPELLIQETVGEPFAADPDALKDTVAPQLVEHKVGVYHARALHLIGDDAADKVRSCVSQCRHEIVQ